jgi:hypothetical protein
LPLAALRLRTNLTILPLIWIKEQPKKVNMSSLNALIILFLFVNAGILQQQGTFVKYDTIEVTVSGYNIIKKDVPINDVGKNYFRKRTYLNNRLEKIEHFESKELRYEDTYTPFRVVFEYDHTNKVRFVKWFNKEGKRSILMLSGEWSREFIYDEQNRILKIIKRDDNGKFRKYDETGKATVEKYTYLDSKVFVKRYDENGKQIGAEEQQRIAPCIPFMTCPE